MRVPNIFPRSRENYDLTERTEAYPETGWRQKRVVIYPPIGDDPTVDAVGYTYVTIFAPPVTFDFPI
jgi:hypothetical protein